MRAPDAGHGVRCAALREPSVPRAHAIGVLRLALLAPDIVEEILDGRADQALMLERLERPLPPSWEEQWPFLPRRRVDH